MSNPAIVLLTDPAQCGQGDVRSLVEALLEIQQMGEHAAPQAFCDHPAAAREFMTAYADAYPKLVLESQAIPTPGHLQSLITNGQIGPIAKPQDMALLDEAWRPPDQNGLNAFPLVVLTLGQPQALLDVLEQNQLIKRGISLIDIAPESASDSTPVSIAEAVATRGLGAEGPWEDAGASGGRLELDEVDRAATPEASDPLLRDGQMSLGLDTVEAIEAPSVAAPMYYAEIPKQPDQAPPASPPAQPEPAVQVEQHVEPPPPPESAMTTPPAELTEAPAQAPVETAWPVTSTPGPTEQVPNEAASDDSGSDGTAPDDADDDASDDGAEHPDDDDDADEPKAPSDDGEQAAEDDKPPLAAGHAASERDDDVRYDPVGRLTAEDDVRYPAMDDDDAPGALRELAAAISDEGILDTDLPSDMLSSSDEDRELDSTILHPTAPHGSRHEPINLEELFDSADPDGDDGGADSDRSHPMHDSDL
jgi:hypothetical protein